MRLIDEPSALEAAATDLAQAEAYYIDTEFESSRRGTVLSLIQISKGRTIYLVDALKLKQLTPLREILTAEGSYWVLHAGLQDVECLRDRLGLASLPPIFDTQVAWAMLGPEAAVSLAYLIYRVLGIRSHKAHQADDWMRRPLPQSQLAYAASDIEHLPELERQLSQRAESLGRRRHVFDASRESVLPTRTAVEPTRLESFRNAWQLPAPNQAGLRSLIDWYNQLGESGREASPPPKTLFSIASRLPQNEAQLLRIKGVPRRLSARMIEDILRCTVNASKANHAGFAPIEPPPYATFEEIRLDAWLARMRAELSSHLSIAPEVALPTRLLRLMAHVIRETGRREAGKDVLSGWRHELLAPAYLTFCEQAPDP